MILWSVNNKNTVGSKNVANHIMSKLNSVSNLLCIYNPHLPRYKCCVDTWRRKSRVFSDESRFKIAMTNCILRYLHYRVYTRERRLRGVCGLAFQSWEKERTGSFLWHADCYFRPPPQITIILEVKAFIQRFCCVIWEMRHWKKPLDQHLTCTIQISRRDANLRAHGPKHRC